MKNWIWWQAQYYEEATPVGGYFNISNEHEKDTRIFVSSFDGVGPFERGKIKKTKRIGFNVK